MMEAEEGKAGVETQAAGERRQENAPVPESGQLSQAGDGGETCLVVGAGIAGLMAARSLQAAGRKVIVLDKGRGVGGRMATRRIEDGTFDHGAQFFTVRSSRFQRFVDRWLEAGTAELWARGFGSPDDAAALDGNPRYRGVPGMTAIPKWLSQGLDIRLDVRITAVNETETGWALDAKDGGRYRGSALVMTPPIPQSLELLAGGDVLLPENVAASLADARYDPCIALMVLMDSRSKVPEPGAVRFDRGAIRWIADNYRKGVSSAYGLTVHTSPEFSRTHWDQPAEAIADRLLELVQPWMDGKARAWQIQKWRYSRPQLTFSGNFLALPGPFPLLFAGDTFGGPLVEGAALSGLSAADFLLAS
jgi:predicted NAD/FAD-dependent oxidoreductase